MPPVSIVPGQVVRQSQFLAPRCLVWVDLGDQSPKPPGIFRFVPDRQTARIQGASPPQSGLTLPAVSVPESALGLRPRRALSSAQAA
jgi:hypothetical protein